MSLRSLFSRRERLRIKASRWLSRLEGGVSEAERQAFYRWLEADRSHAEAFERVKARYGRAGLMAGTEFARAQTVSASVPAAPTRSAGLSGGYAVAAGLAVVAIAGGAILLGRPEALMPAAQAQHLSFATDVGEIRKVPLPDGSSMILDTSTAVTVEMTREVRHLTLRAGRARLAIASEVRPFVASAGPGRVRAAAGIFDIAVTDEAASVQAIQGTILVAASDAAAEQAPLRLVAGEMAMVAAAGAAAQTAPAGGSERLWPTGMIEFDNRPLRDAVAQANRYSRRRILLAQPGLGEQQVSGTFRAGDTAGLARSLAAAFRLRLERSAQGDFILHERADGRDNLADP